MEDFKNRRMTPAPKLRACLNCSIIQPTALFKNNGCPNCPFLQTSKSRNLNLTTTPSFKGIISLLQPSKSWVAKWQRISSYQPGMYAMVLEGELSNEFIDKVERDGRAYISRSASFSLD